MRRTIICALALGGALLGCEDKPMPATSPTPGTSAPAPAADNSAINARDQQDGGLTPLDQGNSEAELELTQRIRKAVMADDSLSIEAKNTKIIARDGHVTLRGPVKSKAEKDAIAKAAVSAAGAGHVTDELEITQK